MTMAGLTTQTPTPPVRGERRPPARSGRRVTYRLRVAGHPLGPSASPPARWLVGLCVGISLMASIWLSKAASAGVVVYTMYAAITAVPFFARDRRRFTAFCRLAALVLVLGGLVAFPLQLYFFWPAVVLLVIASHVGAGHGRRSRALVAVGTLTALAVGVCWAAAIYHTALRPADAYLVIFHSAKAAQEAESTVGTGISGIGSGATGVAFGDHQWKVRFDSGLSSAGKAQLQQRLREVSDGAVVRLCSRWNREC